MARIAVSIVSAVLAGGLLASPAAARAEDRAIDLRDEASITIVGAGRAAAGGDVNGDGIPDVLASRGDVAEEPTNGEVYVVFGRREKGVIDLSRPGYGGFRIIGASPRDYASRATGVGDVNDDGLDDVVVGASGADNNDRGSSGTAYVVFGKRSTEDVPLLLFDLNLQGDRGYRIDGAYDFSLAGEDVAAAGDVNKDGRPDILVGAPFANVTYVVFGQASSDPIDLLDFHEKDNRSSSLLPVGDQEEDHRKGYVIHTPGPEYSDDYSVASAGDVNADGTPDAIIGVIPTPGSTGSAYVVFGQQRLSPLDVRNIAGHGFRIKGTFSGSSTGYSVAGAGDVNGDGLDDVIVGAPVINCCGPGAAYVVFGKRGEKMVKLNKLGRGGFRIRNASSSASRDAVGVSLAGAQDVYGRAMPGPILGAYFDDHYGRLGSGSAYVLFAKAMTSPINLAALRNLGYRIDGANEGDEAGASVAWAGDMNGDDRPDVVVGARRAMTSYVVWGLDE